MDPLSYFDVMLADPDLTDEERQGILAEKRTAEIFLTLDWETREKMSFASFVDGTK